MLDWTDTAIIRQVNPKGAPGLEERLISKTEPPPTYQNQNQPERPAPAETLRDESADHRADSLPGWSGNTPFKTQNTYTL